MPRKYSRSKRQFDFSNPIYVILLVLILSFALYQMWERVSKPAQPAWEPAVPVVPAAKTLPAATDSPAAESPAQTEVEEPGTLPAIAVYFSDPLSEGSGAGSSGAGPETDLVKAIDAAERTVDLAIYNISLENVADALVRAHQRGVQVRMVMESEAMERNVPQRLADAGIPIIGDRREGLMHNKFAVIDGKEVWTGSLNLTNTGAYDDFNNLLVLRSPEIAENYALEFHEMFVEDQFSTDTRPATPNPRVDLSGMPVETYFSPDDEVADQVIRALSEARTSIHFLAYSFTSDPIAEALLEQGQAGVAIRGVFDEEQAQNNTGGEFQRLQEAGHNVRLDGVPGLMHHKVFIIDGETVITGSYNFSASAEKRNDENLVIITDPALAQQYLAEFEKIYENARP